MKPYFFIVFSILLVACGGKKDKNIHEEVPVKTVNVPSFSPDSAYYFVKKQVDFGPRIPNTEAHQATSEFLISQFKNYGASVVTQDFVATTFDNRRFNLRNIIASFTPETQKRILLVAHWDTRPLADKDRDKPNSTFDGANDGASGVGILLEIARVIGKKAPDVGVDIILFDGEDWGEKFAGQSKLDFPTNYVEWWCLGSQHWAKNKHKANYSAYFGICLDMVGGKNAQFAREGYSMEYAPSIVDKVWKTAAQLGFSHIFINQNAGAITDDHRFVNESAHIPMIDIISYDPSTGFGDFHHTRKDNMDIISKETMEAVGETLLHVIYYE